MQLRRAADAESFRSAVELAQRMRHYAIRYITTRPDETRQDETRHDTQCHRWIHALQCWTSSGEIRPRVPPYLVPQMNSRRECAREGLFCYRLFCCDCISLSIANSAVCRHNRRRRLEGSRRGASLAAPRPQRRRASRDGC